MLDGMGADPGTYDAPDPPLPVFEGLIQSLWTAQHLVRTRAIGAAAARDVRRDVLFTAMETQRMYVQTLVDASPGRGVALILNAGLVVAGSPAHGKPFLKLALGKQQGTVVCDANVGMLVGAEAAHPYQHRFFNWEVSVDGGETFAPAPSTSTGTTTIAGLALLRTVGVRVSMTNASGRGPWSQVVTIAVH
jgi:hypothetical protein